MRPTRSMSTPNGMVAMVATAPVTVTNSPIPVVPTEKVTWSSVAVAPIIPLSALSRASTAARASTTRSRARPPAALSTQ